LKTLGSVSYVVGCWKVAGLLFTAVCIRVERELILPVKILIFLVQAFKFAIELGSLFHSFSTFTHTQLCDSFIVSLNTADLTNRKPASATISRYSTVLRV
jgi:hypothetical protein